MRTLFDNDEIVQQRKVVGNPYHSRKGRYTDQKTAAKEKAEKRADVAENRLNYVQSVLRGVSKQYSELLRQNEQLKTELNSYKNKKA